jgi:uncharacterized protein (DUF924 family)
MTCKIKAIGRKNFWRKRKVLLAFILPMLLLDSLLRFVYRGTVHSFHRDDVPNVVHHNSGILKQLICT